MAVEEPLLGAACGLLNQEEDFLQDSYKVKMWYRGRQYDSLEEAWTHVMSLYVDCTISQAHIRRTNAKSKPKWSSVKLKIMSDLLDIKFSDPTLKKKLIETYPNRIVDTRDSYWGIELRTGFGANFWGELLMNLRQTYMRQAT